jgi:hypothetical protein
MRIKYSPLVRTAFVLILALFSLVPGSIAIAETAADGLGQR